MSIARRVTPATYVAYGLTDMLGSGAMAVIGAWVLFFYTSFCGLSAFQAASIFAIARLVDAIGSTTIGHFSDALGQLWLGRTFGRRRAFLLFSLPLLPSFALMWVGGQHYLYYLVTYVFFEVVYAAVLIPYETLAAEMSDDYRTRARFAGARILIGQFAFLVASTLPRFIIGDKARASAEAFLMLGEIFSLIFVASVFATWLMCWERAPDPARLPPPRFTLAQLLRNVALTLRVRAFRLHLGMYLGGYTAIDVFNAVFTYFVVFVLSGNVQTAATLLGVMAFAQFVSVAGFIWIAVRFDPAPAYRLAAAGYVVGIALIALLITPGFPQPMLWAWPAAFVAGLGRGGLVYIPWNTYNYIADVDEAISAERREGVFAGVMTMFRKAVQALATLAAGAILDWSGFLANSPRQPASANFAIIAVLLLGPLVALGFGVAVSRRFTLNQRTHKLLMDEIARFRRGDLRVPAAEAAAMLTDLTGAPLDRLWGGRLHMEPMR